MPKRSQNRDIRPGAFIGAFVLDGRWGLNQGFGIYDDQFDLKKFKHLDLAAVQRPGNQVMDAALHWLDGRKDGAVLRLDPSLRCAQPVRTARAVAVRVQRPRSRWSLRRRDRLRGSTGRIDSSPGCGRRPGSDSTIVVIVGDHGEGLGSHGEGTHGFFIYDYALHVPFIVATPIDELQGVRVDVAGQPRRRVPDRARARRDRVQRQGPWPVAPAVDVPAGRRAGDVYAYSESMAPELQFGWSALHSLRSPRYKYIRRRGRSSTTSPRIPAKRPTSSRSSRRIALDMARELKRLIAETSRDAPAPEAANLDKETVERLAVARLRGDVGRRRAIAGRVEARWRIPRTSSRSSRPCSAPVS